jgi:hypothetical protein
MRKSLIIFAAALLLSAPAFATYWVVLKDGTKYAAKEKPTVVNGKAIVHLESGSTISVDPASIDVAKSEQTTKYGGAQVLDTDANHDTEQTHQQKESLGAAIKLRHLQAQAQKQEETAAAAPVTPASGVLPNDVIDKFSRAYENVGIYEQKVTSPAKNTLHVELTVDTEERVFNAISATSFLISRNAGTTSQIDMVELFMRTTTGGAAGRFQMTRDDALALEGKTMSREDYYVRKVIY